jgi:hypothetical protein
LGGNYLFMMYWDSWGKKEKNILFHLSEWPQRLSHFWMANNLLHQWPNFLDKLWPCGQSADSLQLPFCPVILGYFIPSQSRTCLSPSVWRVATAAQNGLIIMLDIVK